MSRGKYQAKPKGLPILTVALIVLLAVAIISGGTVAYLAKSAAKPAVNTLLADQNPVVEITNTNGKHYVTVKNTGYAVYLRAAVVVNWKNDTNVIAAPPSDFTIDPGDGWVYHNGFYYYTAPVTNNLETSLIVLDAVEASAQKANYTLTVDIAVQAIQALGTTDGTPEELAVLNAWGVQPESLK